MSDTPLEQILASWNRGQITVEEFDRLMRDRYGPTAEMQTGVLLDLDRQRRCGFPEVIYGQGKQVEQLLETMAAQQIAGQPSLITRCAPEAAARILEIYPAAIHHPVARTVRLGTLPATGTPRVMVVTAGATDRPVAEEARETALWMGCEAGLLTDVGVAGPWRLIERRDRLQQADVVVCVAGMEGALPSVVAGWVACPVISVPTSVGYGANLQGLAPLLSMLNSCAANVAVVNIDAGFKGGYLAGMIARQIGQGRGA